MASEFKKRSLCFICKNNTVLNLDSVSCSNEFFNFVKQYFQLQLTDDETELEVFCESCEVKVRNVCELYEQLCEMERRLSYKLGELGELINENQQAGHVWEGDRNGMRSLLALKCELSWNIKHGCLKLEKIMNSLICLTGLDKFNQTWKTDDNDNDDDSKLEDCNFTVDNENDQDELSYAILYVQHFLL